MQGKSCWLEVADGHQTISLFFSQPHQVEKMRELAQELEAMARTREQEEAEKDQASFSDLVDSGRPGEQFTLPRDR
jgi:hypothetical protein